MAETPTTVIVERHSTPTPSHLDLEYTKELIESVITKLSRLSSTPPATSADASSCTTEGISSENCSSVASAEFSASLNDPVYMPFQEDVLRQTLFLRIHDEHEFSCAVYASHIDPRAFRGFLRKLVSNSPNSKLHSPITQQWETKYNAIFDICGRLYAQNIAEDGSSKLVLKTLIDKGEQAELRILVNNAIGAPSEYLYRTVHIYEEDVRERNAGSTFSLTLYGPPLRVPHWLGCSCPVLYASRVPRPAACYPTRSYSI